MSTRKENRKKAMDRVKLLLNHRKDAGEWKSCSLGNLRRKSFKKQQDNKKSDAQANAAIAVT